jgi:hypothetical protein
MVGFCDSKKGQCQLRICGNSFQKCAVKASVVMYQRFHNREAYLSSRPIPCHMVTSRLSHCDNFSITGLQKSNTPATKVEVVMMKSRVPRIETARTGRNMPAKRSRW